MADPPLDHQPGEETDQCLSIILSDFARLGISAQFLALHSDTSSSSDLQPHANINTQSFVPDGPSIDTPELSSGYNYSKTKKKSNWRTLIIIANGVLIKKMPKLHAAISCDPDLMLFTNTIIDSSITFSEFLPNGYNGYNGYNVRDRCKNGGGVMIVTKQEYTITDLDLLT